MTLRLVVADHGDVIGHYDRRRDPLESGDSGWAYEALLNGGAGFRDESFYALYRAVAAGIAQRAERAGG